MFDIESYFMQFEPEVQRRLITIRLTALDVFQDVEEKIYHGIPTFMKNNKDILNYGAYKNHITIYIGYEWVYFLKEQYPQYEYTKAAIKFPNNNPFPDGFIREICDLINLG